MKFCRNELEALIAWSELPKDEGVAEQTAESNLDNQKEMAVQVKKLATALQASDPIVFKKVLVTENKMSTQHSSPVSLVIKQFAHGKVGLRISFFCDEAAAKSYLQDTTTLFVALCGRHPALRSVSLIVRAMLRSWGFFDINAGGIPSYVVTHMVSCFLEKRRSESAACGDLGRLLMELLDFYGNQFDPAKHALSIFRQGGVIDRSCLKLMPENSSESSGPP